MVVVGTSVTQLGTSRRSPPMRRWMTPLIWMGATVIGMLILPSKLVIHFLVYIAIAGIEKIHTARWQRAGALTRPP